jgi:hypothetical protein
LRHVAKLRLAILRFTASADAWRIKGEIVESLKEEQHT